MTPHRRARQAIRVLPEARSSRARRLATALASGCLLATLSGTALAQTSPWFVRASLGFLYDTNYLRLADGQATPAGYSKADSAVTASLAAGFDQMIGRQRVFATAEVRTARPTSNPSFGSDGYGVNAGLDWSTAERLSGSLRASSDRSLARQDVAAFGFVPERNLQTVSSAEAIFRLGLVTALSAEAAGGWRQVDYSSALYDNREFHETWVSAGLRLRPSAISSLGVALRETRGTYPRYLALPGGAFLADDYRGEFVDVTGTYRGSGKTELRARISSGRTRHENATQSDFNGITGSLDWIWEATGKLAFTTTLTREPSQDAYFLSSDPTVRPLEYSRISTGLRVRADYAPTAKIGLNASVAGTHRELSQSIPVAAGGTTIVSGMDRTVVLGLGASWTPVRWLRLGCDVGHEVRRGDAPLSSDLSGSSLYCQVRAELR